MSMRSISTWLISLTALLTLSLPSWASNYPPDYPLSSDCQSDGEVEVCRSIGSDWVAMKVYYRGPLTQPGLQSGLSVWAKLNGHDGFFNMEVYPGSASIHPLAKATMSQSGYDCSLLPRTSSVWNCKQPTPAMQHLLFWAKPEHGTLNANAWDVEIAINLNGTEIWDNNGGAGKNYRFRFEPYGYTW